MDIFDLEEPTRTAVEPDFLKGLNPSQRDAVMTTEGPLLVLSGAGTGKTRVLTTRIAYLISAGMAYPDQILAVTFTNKASKEMKARLEKMIGFEAAGVWLGTFHSIGFKIVSRYPQQAGLKPNFIVLNSDDQERVLKQIMQDAGVDTKKYPPGILLDIIQRWKDRGLAPEDVSPAQNSGYCDGRALAFYFAYQVRLKELNALDFGDLLLLPLMLFKNFPDLLAHYQQKFHYILVDEYQDTNVAQYLLLRLLAKGHNNICCVGDDDQSIYSWRGAEVENILNFQSVFPTAKIIRLEHNYRSTKHILGAASALIANNRGRLGKTLHPATDGEDAQKVSVSGFWNGAQEAEKIIADIEIEQSRGRRLSDMAILVRAGFQTREFEEALIRAGIPYKIIGGFKFYEREEIRDAIAYLRLVLNRDDDLSFLRIVNKPKRGIGEQALQSVRETARSHKIGLFDACALAALRPSVRKTLDAFVENVKKWAALLDDIPLDKLMRQILEESGYVAMWRMDKSVEAEGRLENIQELYNVLHDFKTAGEFIEYVSLVTETDEKITADQLVVMTLHSSKGLEFGTVYLPGWEEGLFPHQKAMDEKGVQGLEEERRLAYVGITRAKERVFVSFASNRRVYGQWQNALPSRFIGELPGEHILDHTDGKLGRGARLQDIPAAALWQPKNYGPREITNSKRVGRRVYHEMFGYGTVIKDVGAHVEVSFDEGGIKKILAKFLEAV